MSKAVSIKAISAVLVLGAFAQGAVVNPVQDPPQVRTSRRILKTPYIQPEDQTPLLSSKDPLIPFPANGEGGVTGLPPGTQVYRNVVAEPLFIHKPGTGQRMADDLSLASGACLATYYSIRVAGLNEGGAPTFDVQTELWDGDPCIPESAIIPGTQAYFMGIPNNMVVADRSKLLDPKVPLPSTVWLAATFSTNDSGWVFGGQAEVGATSNNWSENNVQQNPNEPPTGCIPSTSPTTWGGFWAQVNCDVPGNPMGACCNGVTCTQTTQPACNTGVWQGAFTSCVPNVCLSGACCTGGTFRTCTDTTQDQCTDGLFHPGGLCSTDACGPNFRVYENNTNTNTYDIIYPDTKWGDDLTLGSGAPCNLSGYEVLVAGDSGRGPATFNVHVELWTNDDRGSPASEVDDLPGVFIPGTGKDFQSISANLFSQRLLAGPFPGIPLPKKVWMVTSTNVNNAGPVMGGYASIGSSVDVEGIKIFNAPGEPNAWTSVQGYDGFTPTDCPGTNCVPAGNFRAKVWCEGNPPTGACCSDAAGTCTDGVREFDCEGRWREGLGCGAETFDPFCGASACCYPIGPQPIMLCADLSNEDCRLQDPPGEFKPGKFCTEVDCPDFDCFYHTGDCFSAHAGVGCEDAFCCDLVCDDTTGDPFCCTNHWDVDCALAAVSRCQQLPRNDHCAESKPISTTGSFSFDNTEATTDGPVHPSCETFGDDEHIIKDVWFCWTATCTTQVLARTCGTTSIDSKIAVYEGCTCPPTDARLLDCDDDRCNRQSLATFDAIAGQQYLIRLGSYPGKPGGEGFLTVSCGPPNNPSCPAAGDCCAGHARPGACSDETCCETVCLCDSYCCTTEWDADCAGHGFDGSGCGAAELCTNLCTPPCPSGAVNWITPPSGAVDARIPHAPNNPAVLKGIKVLTVQAPAGSDRVECWDLCETGIVAGSPNAVQSVVDEGQGQFTITLSRPITAGAATTLTYAGSGATATFISHPSNVNSNSAATPSDILDLIDHLNGVRIPPLNPWQCDIDRSGLCAPADILSEIDLLNGNGYIPWNGTSKPATAGVCP